MMSSKPEPTEDTVVVIQDDDDEVLTTPPTKRSLHSAMMDAKDRRPRHTDTQETIPYDADMLDNPSPRPCPPPSELAVGSSFLSDMSPGDSQASLEPVSRPTKKACPSACKSQPCKDEPKGAASPVPKSLTLQPAKTEPPAVPKPSRKRVVDAQANQVVPKAGSCKPQEVSQTPSPKVAQPVLFTPSPPPAKQLTKGEVCTPTKAKVESPEFAAEVAAGDDETPHEWIPMSDMQGHYNLHEAAQVMEQVQELMQKGHYRIGDGGQMSFWVPTSTLKQPGTSNKPKTEPVTDAKSASPAKACSISATSAQAPAQGHQVLPKAAPCAHTATVPPSRPTIKPTCAPGRSSPVPIPASVVDPPKETLPKAGPQQAKAENTTAAEANAKAVGVPAAPKAPPTSVAVSVAAPLKTPKAETPNTGEVSVESLKAKTPKASGVSVAPKADMPKPSTVSVEATKAAPEAGGVSVEAPKAETPTVEAPKAVDLPVISRESGAPTTHAAPEVSAPPAPTETAKAGPEVSVPPAPTETAKAAPEVSAPPAKTANAAPEVSARPETAKAAPVPESVANLPPPAKSDALDLGNVTIQVHPQAEALVPAGYTDRQRLFATFKRNITSEGLKSVPQELKDAWAQAVSSKSKASKTNLFNKWLAAGGEWSKLNVSFSRTKIETETGRRKMGWRTKHQLKLLYGDDNVVNSIVEAKVNAGHWREHPDLPGDSSMLLYYVMVDLSHCSEEQQRDEMKYKFDVDVQPSSEVADIFAGASDMSGASSSWQPMIRLPSNSSQASAEDAQTKGKGKGKGGKTKNGTPAKKENTMPTDVWEAAKYIRPRLLSKLGDAKLWPVKLSSYKHQESLSKVMQTHAVELEASYSQIGCLLKDKELTPDEQIEAANRLAVHRMELYDEDHFTAGNVTKQKKEKTGKGNAED